MDLGAGFLKPFRESSGFSFLLQVGIFDWTFLLLVLVPIERVGLACIFPLPRGRPGFLFTIAVSAGLTGGSSIGAALSL